MRYAGVELHSNEEVKNTVREYPARVVIPVLLAANVAAYAFLFFVPLWYLRVFGWDIHIVGRVIFLAALAIAVLWGTRSWAMYRGTMMIVTNQRVVKVERHGLFDKQVSEIPYESLSDVSYRSKGVFETMIGAGTISFQMLGGKGEYSFKHLLNPAALHKQVVEMRVSFARGGGEKVSDPMEDVMNTVGKLSPTERRALLVNMKKVTPRAKKIIEPTDATE